MQQSSAAAVTCLREAGATGCSDVTGFGLVGNLAEMTRASQVLSQGQKTFTILTEALCKQLSESEVSSARCYSIGAAEHGLCASEHHHAVDAVKNVLEVGSSHLWPMPG